MKKIIVFTALAILSAGCSKSSTDSAKLDAILQNQAAINAKLDALPETIRNLDYFYYTNEVNLMLNYSTNESDFTAQQDLVILNAMRKAFTTMQGKIDSEANQQLLLSSVTLDSVNMILTNSPSSK